MINGRTRYFRRVMRLAAYGAARRFAAVRLSSTGHGNDWHPIVLRWRRRRRTATGISARVSPSRSQTSYFPQFHFHYVSHIHAATDRRSNAGLVSVTLPGERRTMVERRWPMIATNTFPLHGNNVERKFRKISAGYPPGTKRSKPMPASSAPATGKRTQREVNRTASTVRQTSRLPATERLTKRLPSRPVARWPVAHRMNAPLEAEGEVRLNRQAGVHAQLLRRHSHVWHHHHRLATIRRAEPSLVGLDDLVTPSAFRFQQPLPEELIWRRAPAGRFGGSDDPGDSLSPEPANRTSTHIRSQAADASPQAVSPISEPAPPQQITKLDPALLDRLTDNIISRVEKRISIERERRGL